MADRAGHELVSTVVHVRPQQIAHRARLRGQRVLIGRWPGAARHLLHGPRPAAAPGAPGWPAGFCPVDARTPGRWPDLAGLAAGKIRLLGVLADLPDPADWDQPGTPLLWRFHLHYWDWAWGLAAADDRLAARAVFARLWRSWQAQTRFGRGDAWLPYPAALRAWSWCGLHARLVAGSDFESAFHTGLAAHAGFLRRHLESDVGGNHLIKDLKALAGLAVFFGDTGLLRFALRRLDRQASVQILPDGGHYERSPAYHCQVLADLLDVAGLLDAGGHQAPPGLAAAIDRMRSWLGAVLGPDGQVPLLNDGYPVDAELIAALQPAPPPAGPLWLAPDTGLARMTAGGWHLLADVGVPCPPGLPAHAHADTLSCLLYLDGVPLFADTATSAYAPGATRDYERSTAAHNTAEIDAADSTPLWGAFRGGRRARILAVTAAADGSGVSAGAAHDGYRRLPGRPVHRRHWHLSGSKLQVDDLITGRGRHTVAVRWQLAPGCTVRLSGHTATVTSPAGRLRLSLSAATPLTVSTETRPVAAGFGVTTPAPVLVCQASATLPVEVTTVLSRADDESELTAPLTEVTA
jgi:uncharacterized heparinase superfamily protein